MRIARVKTSLGPRTAFWNEGNWDILSVDTSPSKSMKPSNRHKRIAQQTSVQFLPPCAPLVVVGMAHNSGSAGRELPPQAFLRSPRTIVPTESIIEIDQSKGKLTVEGELAVIIGTPCRNLQADQVVEVIAGYTIAADLTADDQICLDGFMTQAKNGDGFTPLGPWIETALDADNASISVQVNGNIQASSNTSGLSYSVTEQLVYLTSHMSLGPGDVVLTGCHQTAVAAKPGDNIVIAVQGIGQLDFSFI